MKKIMCLMFAVVMMFLTTNGVYAEDSQEDSAKLKFLEKLNIVKDVSGEDKITREDFVLYTARAMKLEVDEGVYDGERYFSDVEKDSYASKAINTLTEMGYITGYGQDLFMPKKNITSEEACGIILSVMGYREYAKKYNNGVRYTQLAGDLKMISYSNPLRELTYKDAGILIFNSMITGLCRTSIESNESVKYYTDKEKTLLSEYWGMYFDEGTVTDLYGESLEGDCILQSKELRLDKKTYSVSDTVDESNYLGSYVRIFYYADDKDSSGEITYIMKDVQKTDEIIIDIAQFESFDTKVLKYYSDAQNTRIRKIEISQPIIIYNGLPLSTNVAATMQNLNKGTVTVKDRDNDGNYDTVIFCDYCNFVVGSVDASKKCIYNLLDNSSCIKFDDFDAIRIIDESGNECSFETLSKYTVISVMKSAYPSVKVLCGVVSNKVFNGIYEGIDDEYVKISGIMYKPDKSYIDKFKESVNFGEQYYFYTDHMGNISYVSYETAENSKFGYILKKSFDRYAEYDELVIKMLDDTGTISSKKFAKKARIDGKQYKEYENMLEYLAGQNGSSNSDSLTVNAQLVRYSVNSDGEIIEMDTPSVNTGHENEQSSLIARYTKTEEDTAKWFCADRFGLKAVVNGNTKVFYIPKNNKNNPEQNLCAVGKYTLCVKSDESYCGNAYYTSDKSGFADAAVIYYTPEHLVQYKAVVVSKILPGLNSDEEPVTILRGYENGSYVEYEIDNDISFNGIGTGDLIRLNYGAAGNIIKSPSGGDDVTLIYDFSENKCINWKNVTENYTLYAMGTNSENYRARPQFSYGHIIKRNANIVAWSSKYGKEFSEEASLSGIPIVICDSNSKDKVYLGSADDIIDYESAGTRCDSIIFMTDPKKIFAVIYK